MTEIGAWSSQRQAKSNVLRAIDRVTVFEAYTGGTKLETLQNGTSPTAKMELDADEAAVAGLLRHQLSVGMPS